MTRTILIVNVLNCDGKGGSKIVFESRILEEGEECNWKKIDFWKSSSKLFQFVFSFVKDIEIMFDQNCNVSIELIP